jgi:predicted nuclease with RNAse H fold
MQRPFRRFLGVDLGGGKGKTTAVARLEAAAEGVVEVVEVSTARDGRDPWYDETLLDYVGLHAEGAALAVDAPLTLPACLRCREPICPGAAGCVDPAVVWFRTAGAELIAEAAAADRDRIAAVPRSTASAARERPPRPKPATTPYTQRATEVILHRRFGIIPRETLGQGMGPLTARAAHLVRALARFGFARDENLIEVYPKATLHQLFGHKVARRYKGKADTWETRARVLEELRDTLAFGGRSRLAREACLANDHCFDAVICAYTAWRWAKDGWTLPVAGRAVFAADGWIWAPGLPGA